MNSRKTCAAALVGIPSSPTAATGGHADWAAPTTQLLETTCSNRRGGSMQRWCNLLSDFPTTEAHFVPNLIAEAFSCQPVLIWLISGGMTNPQFSISLINLCSTSVNTIAGNQSRRSISPASCFTHHQANGAYLQATYSTPLTLALDAVLEGHRVHVSRSVNSGFNSISFSKSPASYACSNRHPISSSCNSSLLMLPSSS